MWSSEACDDWKAVLGVPHGGRIGHALKPLVIEHGWDVVRPIWQRFIAEADPRYVNPERFSATFLALLTGRTPATKTGRGAAMSPLARRWNAAMGVYREHGEKGGGE